MLLWASPFLGDEIDARYEEQMKEIVALSGTPETAFTIFSEVVKNLFEWDSEGGGMLQCRHVQVRGVFMLQDLVLV